DFLLTPGTGQRLLSLEDIEAYDRARIKRQQKATERSQALERRADEVARTQAENRRQQDESLFANVLARKDEIQKSSSPAAISAARVAVKSLRKIAGGTEIGFISKEEY